MEMGLGSFLLDFLGSGNWKCLQWMILSTHKSASTSSLGFWILLLFAPSRDWYSSNLEIPFVSFSSTETCSAFRLPVELEVLCLWPPDCQSGRGVHVNDGGPTRISENG